ncbi:MAG TPA: adenylate/guanylate cyclase domain-containing protein [Candidatus Binatia bacterium]|jgi:adenylate cyclase
MGTRANDIWSAASAALLGKPELRGSEVQALAGAREGLRLWQAMGFAPVSSGETVFTTRDADALAFASSLLDSEEPGRELLLQMARTTGQALSRVAHMHVRAIAAEIESAARSQELTNAAAADRVAELAESLVRTHESFLGYIWRRHVLAAISQVVANALVHNGDEEAGTVGFADLVDFTATSQQLTETELIELVDHFEKIAYEEIPARGGRVVKTLGDEVMFSNPNATAAAETALALAAACKADPILTEVRVGLAMGPMLAWEGDLYGPTVNLANRLAAVARPGTVIVSENLAQRLANDGLFALVEIHHVKLKGIGRTQPWVLRPRVDEPHPAGR